MSNRLVNVSHLNFPRRFFCPFFFPPNFKLWVSIRSVLYMLISICAQFHYAYGDSPLCKFFWIPARTHTGRCIRGFVFSPYAYGDISVTNHMHTGNISIWEIKSCIPICVISHTGIAVCIWGSPYVNVRGSLKTLHMGIPVRIMKLCAYGD